MRTQIDLTEFKKSSDTVYTGRPQGKMVREKLNLAKLDLDQNDYKVIFAANTQTINLSFFLGLFFDSIKAIGIKKFEDKYHFDFSNNNCNAEKFLKSDIDQALRNSRNALSGNSIFDFFE